MLLFIMGSRYMESGKVFPAGVVSLFSLVMAGGYIHGIMRSAHWRLEQLDFGLSSLQVRAVILWKHALNLNQEPRTQCLDDEVTTGLGSSSYHCTWSAELLYIRFPGPVSWDFCNGICIHLADIHFYCSFVFSAWSARLFNVQLISVLFVTLKSNFSSWEI